MAGIIEANILKRKKKDKGIVVAIGKLFSDDLTKYIIIRLNNDKGLITQYDYGSDLKISDDIKLTDSVELSILDKYTAEWKKKSL